jgi:hypothetical protein
MGFESKF